MYKDQCVGAIVCKLDVHKNMVHRGYIAMLAVEKEFRRHKIGKKGCLSIPCWLSGFFQ